MLKWDGSKIERLRTRKFARKHDMHDIVKIVKESKIDKYTIYTIQDTDETYHYVQIIQSSVYACIIDEIKYMFDIEKQGTHHYKCGSITYVIYRIRTKKNSPNVVMLPKTIDKTKVNIQDIRMIIVFRYLVGCNTNRNNIKMIKVNKNKYYPISVIETNPMNKNIIANTMLNELGNISINTFLHMKFSIGNDMEANHLSNSILTKVKSVIMKIDDHCLDLYDFLVNRLNNALEFDKV